MVITVEKEESTRLVASKSKSTRLIENAGISFIVGGIMGAVYQAITMWFVEMFDVSIKVACGFSSLTAIVIAALLTGFGVFDTLVSKYKFGLIIPITGFAHSVASALLDYRKDGLVTGLGSNMFKLAGCVILYGTISAFFLALVKVVIYG